MDSRLNNSFTQDRPLVLILASAFISFLFSVTLWFFVDKETGIFVGLWVPSILGFGAIIRKGN